MQFGPEFYNQVCSVCDTIISACDTMVPMLFREIKIRPL